MQNTIEEKICVKGQMDSLLCLFLISKTVIHTDEGGGAEAS